MVAEAYSVMATATDYLPEAIGAYTRLPRQWADSRPIENGKTSLMLLIDQLDLCVADFIIGARPVFGGGGRGSIGTANG